LTSTYQLRCVLLQCASKDFNMAVFNSVINPTWSAFLLLGLTSLLPKQCGGAFGIGDIYDSPRSDGNDSPFSPPQPTATFVDQESGNVTAILGKGALLNCRVRGIGNRTVSWIRHKDTHLLTAGRYTYTSDERFRAIHKVLSEDYLLQILPVKISDSGLYECQISTTPILSHRVWLTVAEPVTEILGAPDIYIEEGVTMNLTCMVRDSPEPPQFIFWKHNDKAISYDSPRGGVSQITEKGETTASFLLIQRARVSDSGAYMCQPSVGGPAGAMVHVIRGADPERWLPSDSAPGLHCSSSMAIIFLAILLSIILNSTSTS